LSKKKKPPTPQPPFLPLSDPKKKTFSVGNLVEWDDADFYNPLHPRYRQIPQGLCIMIVTDIVREGRENLDPRSITPWEEQVVRVIRKRDYNNPDVPAPQYLDVASFYLTLSSKELP